MPYVVRKTDGNVFLIIQDGTFDTSTALTLFGRSFTGYGEFIADNFVHLMENFASNNAPDNPLDGQLWFNKTTQNFRYWNQNSWQELVRVGATGPVGYTGSEGLIGYTGSTGITGSVGFTGSQGEIGATGPEGGSTGPVGFTGSIGEPGASGYTGSNGTGYAGSAGEAGPAPYQQGSPFSFSTLTAYNPNDIVTYGGTFWILSDYANYVQSYTPDTYIGWSPFYLTGPTGYTGSSGDIGYTGSAGINGYVGSTGDIGYTGSQGMITVPVPTTSIGSLGDVQGSIAADNTYFYYCVGNYDGETDIWKRVLWAIGSW